MTESSKNDRTIAAVAHELRQLVDTANAPIFGIDVNGNVNEWNNKTAEITGYGKEDAFDKLEKEQVPPIQPLPSSTKTSAAAAAAAHKCLQQH